jgi:hypothetical protein
MQTINYQQTIGRTYGTSITEKDKLCVHKNVVPTCFKEIVASE